MDCEPDYNKLHIITNNHPSGHPRQVQITRLLKEIRELIAAHFKGDPEATIAGLLPLAGALYTAYLGVGAPADVAPFDAAHATTLAAAPYRIYEKTHTIAIEQHRYQMAMHIAQLKKLNTIIRSILNSIKGFPTLEAQCTAPHCTFMGTDLHYILNALTAASKDITFAELEQISHLMATPFTGGAIETFHFDLSKLVEYHLITTGVAMPEHEILRIYSEAISSGPYAHIFTPHLARFNRDRPLSFGCVAAGRERRLTVLQTAITTAFNSLSLSDKESAAAANAATIAIQAETLAEIETKASRIRKEQPKRDPTLPYSPPTLTPEKHRQQKIQQDINKLVAQAIAKQATLPKPTATKVATKVAHKPTPSSKPAAKQSSAKPRSRSTSPDVTLYECIQHGIQPGHPTSICRTVANMTAEQRDAKYKEYYGK